MAATDPLARSRGVVLPVPRHRARVGARLPLAVTLPLIAGMSLLLWFVLAGLASRIARLLF